MIRSVSLESASHQVGETRTEQKNIDSIKEKIASIKTHQDFLVLQNALEEIAVDNEGDFLLLEKMAVEKVSGLVEIGNYDQMRDFIESCYLISTRNLLVVAFFEREKLLNSKEDILCESDFVFVRCPFGNCSRFFGGMQEFFLGKILKSQDKFSAIELEFIFSNIGLEMKRKDEFLDNFSVLKETK